MSEQVYENPIINNWFLQVGDIITSEKGFIVEGQMTNQPK